MKFLNIKKVYHIQIKEDCLKSLFIEYDIHYFRLQQKNILHHNFKVFIIIVFFKIAERN